MKVLLLGEYSNVHWTLAQGLRVLGCDVIVASNGDRFKNYSRDIDLKRSSNNVLGTIRYVYDLIRAFRNFKGYDVVQIINPLFLDLKAEKNLQVFEYLKRHNKRVFLGAFGTDYFWIKACIEGKTFRYSDYLVDGKPTNFRVSEEHRREWVSTVKESINRRIADRCDGIIACLYEYYAAYKEYYDDKLAYISEPVNTKEITFTQRGGSDKVRFFIGIQKERSQLKGTDVMYRVLQEVQKKYSTQCIVNKVESVPYDEYINMMNDSDVILDQLYSYTPGMNALAAMGQGLVLVGGGEPEAYELLGEYENRPIINVVPNEEDIFAKLEWLIVNKHEIASLSRQSKEFIDKHHDYIFIAQQYINFWKSR